MFIGDIATLRAFEPLPWNHWNPPTNTCAKASGLGGFSRKACHPPPPHPPPKNKRSHLVRMLVFMVLSIRPWIWSRKPVLGHFWDFGGLGFGGLRFRGFGDLGIWGFGGLGVWGFGGLGGLGVWGFVVWGFGGLGVWGFGGLGVWGFGGLGVWGFGGLGVEAGKQAHEMKASGPQDQPGPEPGASPNPRPYSPTQATAGCCRLHRLHASVSTSPC